MQEILKSSLLEFEKSTFLIDIIKFHSGEKYINIQQTITGQEGKQVLKINPSVLPDIISVLQMYQKEMDKPGSKEKRNYFSKDKQQKIVTIYLKGVPIKDVALQFNCTPQIIEQILLNKQIEIIDQRPPQYAGAFERRRRRNY
jgi:hypothetical protein